MSTTQSELNQQQPPLPAKPEARRGVVTNPIVVSNARGERKNKKQSGQNKNPNTSKNNNSNGKKGKSPGADSLPRKPNQPSGIVSQPNSSPGLKKKKNGTPNGNSNGTPNGNPGNPNGMATGEPGKRSQGKPVSNPDAYSGSSFHSAPAASSLPRPSFGASPQAVPPPPQTWNGAPSAPYEMPQMPHMMHMPMPMASQYPGHAMMPPGYPQFGYYPNHGYGMPMNYNGYYYPPPGGVAGTPNGQ